MKLTIRTMIGIIALNNPDSKYDRTRHNVGRALLEFWIHAHNVPEPELDKQMKLYIGKTLLHDKEILYGWPNVYMNESGIAIQSIIRRYEILPEDLWILHDEIDIPIGEIKISRKKGAAGHHGVESVMKILDTKDFNRIRIGIQPKNGKTNLDENFVLKQFSPDEKTILAEKMPEFSETIDSQLKIN